MSDMTKSRALPAARWLVYLIMALVAFVALVILAVAVILPFQWDEAATALAKSNPGVDLKTLFPSLLMTAMAGLATLGLIWSIMRNLLAIIASVELADPFIHANAKRLKVIGWLMIAIQFVGFPLAMAAEKTADMFGQSDTGFDLSLNAILAILLVFILAGIFERGAEMREELEGTV